jgi:Zn-dependent protease
MYSNKEKLIMNCNVVLNTKGVIMNNNENELNNTILNEKQEDVTEINIESKKENFIVKLKDKKGIWGVLGAILLVLAKFKPILILILVKFKFLLIALKLAKFASTLISMLLMIIIYAKMYGWAFGLGFVLLLFVHEMGHYLSAKIIKLDVTLPIFIPFVGAAIRMKEEPKDAAIEAKLAIGGPLLGSLGALICLIFHFILNEDFLMALAYSGFILNLFNLIPLHPLDGGRVVSAISPKLWFIGIPIGIVALVKFFNPILLIILVLGIMQVISHYKDYNKSYYEVKILTRVAFSLVYFGLMLLLGIGITYIHGIHSSILIQ